MGGWARTLGGWMVRLALIWLALIPLLFVLSFAYDARFHPHDSNLPGLLATASLFYFFFRPWGLGLLVAGVVLRKFGDG